MFYHKVGSFCTTKPCSLYGQTTHKDWSENESDNAKGGSPFSIVHFVSNQSLSYKGLHLCTKETFLCSLPGYLFLNCRNYLVSITLVEHTAYSSISWKHIRIRADHLRKLILQSSTRMSGNKYWNFRSAQIIKACHFMYL